jgi:hypothetical protein
MIHSVVLSGLIPATVYYYQYGNAVEGYGPVLSFTSAKPTGPNVPVSFLAIGDVGLGPAPGL